MGVIQYTKEEIVDIRDKMSEFRVPECLQFPDEQDGSPCRWAIVHTVAEKPKQTASEKRKQVKANAEARKAVRFSLPLEFSNLEHTSGLSPTSSAESSSTSFSGQMILDAITSPKRKVTESKLPPIPISFSSAVDYRGTLPEGSRTTTTQYLLNMVTGDVEEVTITTAPSQADIENQMNASIKLELEKLQRKLPAPASAVSPPIPKNEDIQKESEKIQHRVQQPDQRNTDIMRELEKIQRPKAEKTDIGCLKSSNCFSIFGIPVGGIELMQDTETLRSPEPQQSESTEMTREHFNFNSWIETISELDGVENKPKAPKDGRKGRDMKNNAISGKVDVPWFQALDIKLPKPEHLPQHEGKVHPVWTSSPIIEEIDKKLAFHKMLVKHVTSPDKFVLQREETEQSRQALDKLHQGMMEHYKLAAKEQPLKSGQIMRHNFYAGLDNDTGLWFRVFTLNNEATLVKADQFRVMLIDYGSEKLMDVTCIQPLREKFCKLPMQTFQAKLHACPKQLNFSTWTKDDIDKFRDEIEGKTFLCGIFGKTTLDFERIPTLSVGLIDEGNTDSDQSFYTFGSRLQFALF